MAYKMKGHSLPGPNQRSPLRHPHSKKVAHGDTGHNTNTGKSVAEGGVAKPGNPNYEPPKKPSPTKQAIGGGAGEALEHWKRYKKLLKKATSKIIPGAAINKEITRVAKGGKPKAELIKEASKKTTKKVTKKVTTKVAKEVAKKSFDKWMLGIVKKGGTRAMGTIGAYLGSMGTAKGTQPGTGKHGGTKKGKYNPKTGKYE